MQPQKQFSKFFMLSKIDEVQGIAEGVAACEELDHDGEILDYAGSKPYFQRWSESQMQASKGKSKGNVRLQHDDKRPVGRLLDIQFDDAAKTVRVSAKIEETEAKNLLASGVLTGFSIGGDYIRRTPQSNGSVRYIAGPAEISVCDRPCSPSAVFSAIKAGGQTELRKFRTTDRSADSELKGFCKRMKAQGWSDSMIAAARGISYGALDKMLGRGHGRTMELAMRKSQQKGHYSY